MNQLNDYNKISEIYNISNTKPDKLYSILPTILKISETKDDLKNILDLGCGNGFFTFPLALKYKNTKIVGIDNSEKQIHLAQEANSDFGVENVNFILGDIRAEILPKSDLIIAPFIFGYFTGEKLDIVIKNIFESLEDGGLLTIVLDNPKNVDNSKFGARKIIKDGIISIELFNNNEYLTTLKAIYHDVNLFKQKLSNVGFKSIQEFEPIIDPQSYDILGKDFWNNYIENSELIYLVCKK